MALFCGAHYNYIDFSLTVGSEAGTAASRMGLRRPFAILSEFVHGLDLVRARPRPDLVDGVPAHTVAAVLAVADEEYRVYLADDREHQARGVGTTLNGTMHLRLPEGRYAVSCLSPTQGARSPAILVGSDADGARIFLPDFCLDIALIITPAPRRGAEQA
jgi:hypothetical protein